MNTHGWAAPLATLLVTAAAVLTVFAGPASAAEDSGFVTRSGNKLMLDGKEFRFSGANVEWLGLVGYGPHNHERDQIARLPSTYEIDDALATAKEMGATVVRAQTLGDTVGCANCLQPKLGEFNEQAFRILDYALVRARANGIRLIFEFQGDAGATGGQSSADVFSRWRNGADFWTDPTVINDFKNHIARIVNRVNSYTGIAYKDDPTIFGWMDCNACELWAQTKTESWLQQIAPYVKSLDSRHLFITNAFFVRTASPAMLANPNIDVFTNFVYPHWGQWASGDRFTGLAPVPHENGALTVAQGKPFFFSEIGWDRTNWETSAALQTLLEGIVDDPNISGDLFWALEAHTNGHGWKPLPANNKCQPPLGTTEPVDDPSSSGAGCYTNEDGQWWALYYTGITTLSHTAADMAERAQMLRTHAYKMRGLPTPPHGIPPAPIITSTEGGKVVFQGAAGAAKYSVQKWSGSAWSTICDGCTTDLDGGYKADRPGCFRVIGHNLDGVAGRASEPAGSGCPVTRKTCASRRTVTFTLPKGASAVKVTVDGKARRLPRRGRSLKLALNGLPKRAVTVRIRARLRNHKTYRRTTTLHPCRKASTR